MHKIVKTLAIVIALGYTAQLAGQAPASNASRPSASGSYKAPRTAWGHPDLQGLWNNGTTTPLERPADLADREFLTDEEWAIRAKDAATRAAADRRPENDDADLALAYNNEWWDRGAPLKRTSLIVDPPNGRLPALTPEGQKRVAARAAAAKARGPADSWEDRPLQERCLVYHGVPPFPTGYNNNYEIVQTRDVVAIRYEMLAETRIIPLDNRPHLTSKLPQWLGSARGRWEGETLVVETTSYHPRITFRFPASPETLRIVERFTRTSPDAVDYRFTVHDPTMYTQPWTAVLPMSKTPGPIYEYACHEGNYGMSNLLRGHRVQEQEEAAKKR
jgi:hypothetical protein